MNLNDIRRLFLIDPLEDRINKALSIVDEIESNKFKANELAKEFVPFLNSMKRKVLSMEKYCDSLEKSNNVEYGEGLVMLERFRNKYDIAKSEYYGELGTYIDNGYKLEAKLNDLRRDPELYNRITQINKNNSLEKGFRCVFESFNKGLISQEMFIKAFKSYDDNIVKAKYIKREGTPGNYKYIYEEPEKKDEKMESIEELRSEKNKLLTKFDELSKEHKKLYGNIDISQPKSNEEKESERVKNDIASKLQQIVKKIQKHPDFNKQEKPNIKKSILGEYGDKVIEIIKKALKNKKTPERYSKGCLMLKISIPNWDKVLDEVEESDLYTEKEGFGKEADQHITVLYGFDLDKVSLDDIHKKLTGIKEISFKIKDVSGFENEDFDVLKFGIESKDLQSLNKKVSKLPYSNDHPDYNPHITIAYLKSGKLKDYEDKFKNLVGKEFKSSELIYSHNDENGRVKSNINLEEIEKAEKTAQEKKIEKVMSEFKAGTLRSNSGEVVTDKDQALAIVYSYFKSEDDELKKSFDNIKKAYQNSNISKELFLKALDNYIEKGKVGTYEDNPENKRLHRVGQKYGEKKQEEQTEEKDKKQEQNTEGGEKSLEDHAKNASGSSLEHASKEAKDPEVRVAAKKELNRREKEESGQDNESDQPEKESVETDKKTSDKEMSSANKEGEETKKTGLNAPENEWIKEFANKYKLSRLPLGIPKNKVQVNEDGDTNSHWVMKWVDPKTGKEVRSYTKEFLQKNAEYKWDRIKNIKSEDINKIKSVATKALDSEDSKEQQIGAVLSIIMNTGLRIGSKDGFNQTQNRGVSTLSPENVKINGDKISFEFTGKSYKNNTAEIKDKKLAKVLSNLIEKNKGKEFLFDNISDDGVRDYFHNNVSKDLKIKDMRTYVATDLAKKILFDDKNPPPPLPNKGAKKAIQNKLTEVYKKVSEQLNNTPSMAKNSYIHPKVTEEWLNKLGVILG